MKRGWILGLLAAVVVAGTVALLAIMVVRSNETLVIELDVGDCLNLPDDVGATIDRIDPTSCSGDHQAEVVAAGELNPDGDAPYPTDAALFAEVDRLCAADLDDQADVLTDFGILPVAANESAWVPLDGRYVCLAIPYGGGTTTGSLTDR